MKARRSDFIQIGRNCTGFAVWLLLGLPLAAQSAHHGDQTSEDPKAIVTSEAAFQKFEAEQNIPELQKLALTDFVEADRSMMSRDDLFAMLRKVHALGCQIGPVKMIEPKVSFLAPEVATIVYHASQTGTCGEHSLTAEAEISTVWIHRDGRWQAAVHTEFISAEKAH